MLLHFALMRNKILCFALVKKLHFALVRNKYYILLRWETLRFALVRNKIWLFALVRNKKINFALVRKKYHILLWWGYYILLWWEIWMWKSCHLLVGSGSGNPSLSVDSVKINPSLLMMREWTVSWPCILSYCLALMWGAGTQKMFLVTPIWWVREMQRGDK